jgi:hypothetical protein
MHPQLDQGAPFVWSNRNKKSIALDLKSPQGLALARDLVCRADVLVENFSSGVMRRLGLDHETCLALNPRPGLLLGGRLQPRRRLRRPLRLRSHRAGRKRLRFHERLSRPRRRAGALAG